MTDADRRGVDEERGGDRPAGTDLARALRAGVAIYDVGEYHAAHDAWEDHWLDLPEGTDDERLLHGLIQFTAAVYHARRRNWSGATGLAGSAGEYLANLPAHYRGVNLAGVRRYLGVLHADPEVIERRPPLALRIDGERLRPAELDFETAAIAADVIAGEYEAFDTDRVARAVELAREEVSEGTETRFTALVMDFADDAANRGLIYRRLSSHLERREREREDVDGLFD
jgi:predicted metal-dependent hydrolase